MLSNRISYLFKQIIKSSLLKSSGIYTLSNFINASIPFLLVPVLTRYLSPSDYGIVSMFLTVSAFLMPLVDVNLSGAISRKFYSKDNVSEYIGNCLYIFFSSTVLSLFIILILRKPISNYTLIPQGWVIFVPLYCAFQFISKITLVLWQVREKPIKYGAFQIVQSLLNAGLSIIFIVFLKQKWEGRILALILASIVLSTISFYILIKNRDIIFKFNKQFFIHALKYGGGLIPHTIGGSLMVLINRFFLTNLVNIEQTGLYSVAIQIASVLSFFLVSFNTAYIPWLFKKLSNNKYEDKIKIVKFTYIYFIGLWVAGLFFYLSIPLLFHIFVGPKFQHAKIYVAWIILSFVFDGMYYMVGNYIFYAEKTLSLALVSLSIGVLNIPISYLCITYLGGIGASVALTIISALTFIATWMLSARVYKMPWISKTNQ